jgi:hypothetical protein
VPGEDGIHFARKDEPGRIALDHCARELGGRYLDRPRYCATAHRAKHNQHGERRS